MILRQGAYLTNSKDFGVTDPKGSIKRVLT